jgi:glycosyltransferase involved in cell wall biosynthesis
VTTESRSREPGGVLVLGRAIHPPWNEGARVIARSVVELAAERRPVRVVSLTRPEYLPTGPVADGTLHVPTTGAENALGEYRSLPALVRATRQVLREQPIAVAHLIALPLALAPMLQRAGVRVVTHATLGGHAYQGRVEGLRERAARVFDHWVDAYACASETVRSSLAEKGHATSRLHVFGPPTDERRFVRQDRAAARRQLGLDEDGFLVVYVGTITPIRFPAAEIAPALVRAAADVPGLRLQAYAPVGTHSYNERFARESVEPAAAATGAAMAVRLEDLDEERKALVYNAADVVLLPFGAPVAVEPPLTLLEALASEATVLVAPAANRSGLVEDGRTGFTYSTVEELVDRLRTLHALGEEGRREVGRAGRELVIERFGRTAALRSLEALWAGIGVPEGAIR